MKKVYIKGYQKEKDFPSHFVFFSLSDPSRIWHSEGVSDDIRFLCTNLLRSIINGGLWTQILTGMSRLECHARLGSGRHQKALRNWDWLAKLAKAHKKKPGTLVGCAVRGSPSREGTKVAFLKDVKKGTCRHNGSLKDLSETTGTGETRWRMCGSASVTRGTDWEVNLKVACVSSSKVDLKIIGDPGCSWCVYANEPAKLKAGFSVVPLITMRAILGIKIVVWEKSQCSVLDIKMAQLS